MKDLPSHLQKYIVEQNYEKYTPVDHAVWRYILRQLKSFLAKHAHSCYLDGLEKTGIEIEQIPRISEISKKLENFGWRALPVSGFIPPAAFMELQSLGILPIASEMRSMSHLMYTPAPDIVHEAAGHAPILVDPEFAGYLKKYAQVATKAIISREDLDMYEAIRVLSDVKENPNSTSAQIEEAEKKLLAASKALSHVSEATELSRMNWWTAEYGLIGPMENPKIFGAGLLSSLGESKWCLSDKVKKIPLTLDCIKTTYDITEPQPQLFVAPDFKRLGEVLEELADQMAFRRGGTEALQKAVRAETVNTVQLNSGIQISGQFLSPLLDKKNQIVYLRTQGPTQIAYQDKELDGQGEKQHPQGFGTPLGSFRKFPNQCPSLLSMDQWLEMGINFKNLEVGKKLSLHFMSGVIVEGQLKSLIFREDRPVLISFAQATVYFETQILFDPAWGVFDMVLGSDIVSVFAGPADKQRYGQRLDFVAARVPSIKYSKQELERHRVYQLIRDLRKSLKNKQALEKQLPQIFDQVVSDFPNDWLVVLEIYEICIATKMDQSFSDKVLGFLQSHSKSNTTLDEMIADGLRLVQTDL